MSSINARSLAYEVLFTIIQEDGYSNITLNKYFNQYKVYRPMLNLKKTLKNESSL